MTQEGIQKALEALGKSGITVQGDLVLEKHVEHEVGNVEAGGIGIQINNAGRGAAQTASEANGKQAGEAQAQAEGDANASVPECLATPEAEELWQRLRQAGFIQLGGYGLSNGVSANQATYIASCMADCLHITPKWKPFQALWGIRNMAQMAGAWAQTGKLPPRAKDIDRALK